MMSFSDCLYEFLYVIHYDAILVKSAVQGCKDTWLSMYRGEYGNWLYYKDRKMVVMVIHKLCRLRVLVGIESAHVEKVFPCLVYTYNCERC